MDHFPTQQYYDPASARWTDFDFAFFDHLPYPPSPPSELTIPGSHHSRVSSSSQHSQDLQSSPPFWVSQSTDNDHKAFLDLGTGPGLDLSRRVSDFGPESDLSSYQRLDPYAKLPSGMFIGVDLDPRHPRQSQMFPPCMKGWTIRQPTNIEASIIPTVWPIRCCLTSSSQVACKVPMVKPAKFLSVSVTWKNEPLPVWFSGLREDIQTERTPQATLRNIARKKEKVEMRNVR
ncbi:hypothetical protein FCOIX_12303 [Fusarium coicis]|nr:hypothetical protein FCOIX_12303 [Fusarium coicis]